MSRNNPVEVLHNSARDRAKCAIPIKNLKSKGLKFAQKPPSVGVLVQKGFRSTVLKKFPTRPRKTKTETNYTVEKLGELKLSNGITYTFVISNQPPEFGTLFS